MPTNFDPYPFSTAIGRIVSCRDVEDAALRVLKKWSNTYIAAFEDQSGRPLGSLPRIRSYTTTPTFDKWPEDQLPCVLLISPGIIAAPVPDGQGFYRASFSLALAVVVSAATMADTEELAKLYIAALRTVLIQHQSLEGFSSAVDWLDENYDDLPLQDTRSLGAGQAIFGVEVYKLARRFNGPKTPWEGPVDYPLPDDTIVERVIIDTEALPIDEEEEP